MKKHISTLLAGFIALLLVTGPSFGHSLFMNLTDNGDGTVAVEGMFSTGATAANLPLYLLDNNEKQILKIKLDENGEAEFTIPDQPYTVFLDGGPGHTVREDGPMGSEKKE
ncbi:hypothetical protein [Desulfobacter vibrioformis]|uniref:hypothetical protein n=1 Tax=Desulfobacter vibrioformis TaxID=34031 RepID=UPI0005586930|nr:hypothetical protein [Desulfobacter vibrioformis]